MLQPDVAVVTSIASEHHRSLGTLDDIARGNHRSCERSDPAGSPCSRRRPSRPQHGAGGAGARYLTYGFGKANDVRPLRLALDWPNGTQLTVQTGEQTIELSVGRAMICRAGGRGRRLAEGRSLAEAATALATVRPQPERLERRNPANYEPLGDLAESPMSGSRPVIVNRSRASE